MRPVRKSWDRRRGERCDVGVIRIRKGEEEEEDPSILHLALTCTACWYNGKACEGFPASSASIAFRTMSIALSISGELQAVGVDEVDDDVGMVAVVEESEVDEELPPVVTPCRTCKGAFIGGGYSYLMPFLWS